MLVVIVMVGIMGMVIMLAYVIVYGYRNSSGSGRIYSPFDTDSNSLYIYTRKERQTEKQQMHKTGIHRHRQTQVGRHTDARTEKQECRKSPSLYKSVSGYYTVMTFSLSLLLPGNHSLSALLS